MTEDNTPYEAVHGLFFSHCCCTWVFVLLFSAWHDISVHMCLGFDNGILFVHQLIM